MSTPEHGDALTEEEKAWVLRRWATALSKVGFSEEMRLNVACQLERTYQERIARGEQPLLKPDTNEPRPRRPDEA